MSKTQNCGSCRNADSDGIPLSKTCQWQCEPNATGGSLYVSINLPPKVDEAAVLRRENRELRVLLAVRVSGQTLYADDGELSDCSEWPYIDYKRDTPEQIKRALQQRAHRSAFEDTQPMGHRQSGIPAK